MKKSAFTLIELLVVIVIIGILATMTTATFSGSRQKADEAKVLAERSDACKEALAACTSLGNSGCETFEQCMTLASMESTILFTLTDYNVDPNFSIYVGNWFNSGETTSLQVPVYTNGIAGITAYVSPMDVSYMDPANYTWDSTVLFYFNTFEDAKAYDAFAPHEYIFWGSSGEVFANDEENPGNYIPVGSVNIP